MEHLPAADLKLFITNDLGVVHIGKTSPTKKSWAKRLVAWVVVDNEMAASYERFPSGSTRRHHYTPMSEYDTVLSQIRAIIDRNI